MSVVAADLNGDGAPDVLSASLANDVIAWYENQTSTGTADDDGFGHGEVITTAAEWAKDVHTADLDGDGDRDVLSASSYDDRIAWYENQIGDASADSDGFGDQLSITTGADGAQDVHAADLDGDGDPDVLAAASNADKIAWYENQIGEAGADLDGFASERVITSEAAVAYSVTTADLDGDGDPDVVSASSFDDRIAWYENRLAESGSFGPQRTIATTADGAASVTAEDLDGDGDPDVLSASSYDDRIVWYENRLTETDAFGASMTITSAAKYAASVRTADLDGDGDPDVLSASRSDDRIAWYENQLTVATADADGFGSQQTITTAADEAQFVSAADLDGNGTVDVLSASSNDDKVAWYSNTDGALPVEIVAFKGRQRGGDAVKLTWRTASEMDNAEFHVQRSVGSPRGEGSPGSEAVDWRVVGRVEGGGTTRDPQTYRHVDSDLPFGADSLVYRLRQVDVDGTWHYSRQITVGRGEVSLRLMAPSPNPAHRHVTVRFAVPEAREATLSLHNVLGKRVRFVRIEQTSERHKIRLDISSLPSGPYFLRLRTKMGQKTTQLTVLR